MEEDWDNLLILDACRFDLFESIISEFQLDGELVRRQSRGTGSVEFLEENFNDTPYPDTVYVTANPFVKQVLDNVFAHTEHVWLNEWDEKSGTITPEAMYNSVIDMNEQFPNKRLMAHFMQPHHPFIGETRLEADPGLEWARAKATGEESPDIKFVWEQLRNGRLSRDKVWRAYGDNLRCVLPTVRKLGENLTGKTIVTSDHGNAFGASAPILPTRVYGHGQRMRISELIDIPWFTIPHDERKEITSTSVSGKSSGINPDDEVINERLEALGYKSK
ncbi:hypothetical protein [Halorubrum halophilum]|uniref:hypothetical protein n=1 Tax=Halorubrum halophilum TaxID=413816 RepID=UPI00186ACD49|nr:hypothetical protein [Halorubrum halophilum]